MKELLRKWATLEPKNSGAIDKYHAVSYNGTLWKTIDLDEPNELDLAWIQ